MMATPTSHRYSEPESDSETFLIVRDKVDGSIE